MTHALKIALGFAAFSAWIGLMGLFAYLGEFSHG